MAEEGANDSPTCPRSGTPAPKHGRAPWRAGRFRAPTKGWFCRTLFRLLARTLNDARLEPDGEATGCGHRREAVVRSKWVRLPPAALIRPGWLRRALTNAAWAATHTHDTCLAAQYHRLAGRRGKKRTLVAVGHTLLEGRACSCSQSDELLSIAAHAIKVRGAVVGYEHDCRRERERGGGIVMG